MKCIRLITWHFVCFIGRHILFQILQIEIVLYYTKNPDIGRETPHLINKANNLLLFQIKDLAGFS